MLFQRVRCNCPVGVNICESDGNLVVASWEMKHVHDLAPDLASKHDEDYVIDESKYNKSRIE